MGRIKRCRMCKEVLVCMKCGTRQTPEAPDRKKFTMQLTDEERDELKERAKKRGMTVAAYIKNQMKL